MPDKPNVGHEGHELSEQEALNVQTGYPGYKPYEDDIFDTGPVTLDIEADTGKVAHGGYVACNRSKDTIPELGEILVELKETVKGISAWGEQFTLTPGDIISLDGHKVQQIRLDLASSANSRYRVLADKLY